MVRLRVRSFLRQDDNGALRVFGQSGALYVGFGFADSLIPRTGEGRGEGLPSRTYACSSASSLAVAGDSGISRSFVIRTPSTSSTTR